MCAIRPGASVKNMFLFSVINITAQVMGTNSEHTSLSFGGMIRFFFATLKGVGKRCGVG